MSKQYTSVDDPKEKVEIVSQEKNPNGRILYNIVEPTRVEKQSLRGLEFHQRYKDLDKPVINPDERPTSASSQAHWRRWALHLERQNEELLKELEYR